MVLTTALRALVLGGLIFVDPEWTWTILLTVLYVATFLFSTFSQFFGPAEGALIPRLVGRRQLIAANSLFNLTFFSAQFLGFAVLGPLLTKAVGRVALFQIATLLYIFCTLLVWLLPRDEAPPPDSLVKARSMVASVWHDFVDGARVIWRDKMLVKAIAYLSIASSAFLMLGALGPAFVTRVLGIPAADLGFILAPAGIGILAGIMLVNRFAHADNRERMIDLGILASGVATLLFALTKPTADAVASVAGSQAPLVPVVGIIMLLAAVLGAGNAFIIVPSQTILQERSAENMRARVYAAFYTVSSAAALGPVLFAGALADLFDVITVLILIGLSLLGVGAWSYRHTLAGTRGQGPGVDGRAA
jgi:hypothetical protein